MSKQPRNPVSFLLLSGGTGTRCKHFEPKQFYKINGHPMIAYAVMAAAKVSSITEILVNAPPGFEQKTLEITKKYAQSKSIKILPCGTDRQESSLILCKKAQNKIVIIHESARPMIDADSLEALIADNADNAGYCLPVSFSTCKVNLKSKLIVKGIPRDAIYNIQLPQKFHLPVLLKAHDSALIKKKRFTEDAIMCIEMTGEKVLAIEGNSSNIKVTSQDDFLIAEAILKGRKQ